MKIKEAQIKEKFIAGVSVRTKNENEMNFSTARLPQLWGKFYKEGLIDKIPNKLPGSPVYGVYHSYESDLNGEYSVLAGVEIDGAANGKYSSVKIEGAKYLVFEGKGEMPRVVIDTWKNIWDHFSLLDAGERAYLTDFEVYAGPNEVAIYVGVK